MTVLELVIVLGIVAGATAIAAASVPKLASTETPPAARLSAFVRDVQLAATRNGRPLLLVIEQGSAQAGGVQISWAVSDLRVLVGGQLVRDHRVLVSSEGIIGGEKLSLEAGGVITAVPGVHREALQ